MVFYVPVRPFVSSDVLLSRRVLLLNRLAGCASQSLWFNLQPRKRNRCIAVRAQPVARALNALKRVLQCVEILAFDVGNNAFNFMGSCELARVLAVLQQVLMCGIRLRLAPQM